MSVGASFLLDCSILYAVDARRQARSRVSQIRMSSVDNPYDNAKAESFFKTLKQEEVYIKGYRSFEEAEANLDVFLEQVYNMKQLHSSLGYVPPVEFEEAYASFVHTNT